jgi:hypothetical protein
MSERKKAVNTDIPAVKTSMEKKGPVSKTFEEKRTIKKSTESKSPEAKLSEVKSKAVKKIGGEKKADTMSNISIHIQFAGKSYTTKDLIKIAKNVWVYDLGKKASDFNSLDLYVKSEENTAYYIINETVKGRFFI